MYMYIMSVFLFAKGVQLIFELCASSGTGLADN